MQQGGTPATASPGPAPMGQLLGPSLPGSVPQNADPNALRMAFQKVLELNGGKIFPAAAGIKSGQLGGFLQLGSAPPSMVERYNPIMPSYGGLNDYMNRMQAPQPYAPPPLPQSSGVPFNPAPPKRIR